MAEVVYLNLASVLMGRSCWQSSAHIQFAAGPVDDYSKVDFVVHFQCTDVHLQHDPVSL